MSVAQSEMAARLLFEAFVWIVDRIRSAGAITFLIGAFVDAFITVMIVKHNSERYFCLFN